MAIKFYECGCCGCYHKEGFYGDCRNDNERYSADDIEFFSATDDFEVVSLEEQLEGENEKDYF